MFNTWSACPDDLELAESVLELHCIPAEGETLERGSGGKPWPKKNASGDFFAVTRARCTFFKNMHFHTCRATETVRAFSIFVVGNVCISRARSSWEPKTDQKRSSRPIF